MRHQIKCTLFIFALCFLSGCNKASDPQDQKFVEKVKTYLVEKGDSAKVSEMHAGNWQEVCFVRSGVGTERPLRGIANLYGLSVDEVEVINRGKKSVKYTEEFGWGIYFYYEPNQIEFYKINYSQMLARPKNLDNYDCAKRETAYFFRPNDKKDASSERFYLGFTTKTEAILNIPKHRMNIP